MGILSYLKLKFGIATNMESVIVADIGFNSIKTALISIDKQKNKFSIIDSNKERTESQFTEEESLNFQDLKINFQKSARNLLKRNKSVIKIDKLFIISGKGLIENSFFDIEFKRNEPQKKVDMTEVKEILEKSFSTIQEKISQDQDKEQGDDAQSQDVFKIVNGVIQNISVDGYSVTHPLGFQGKNIKLNISCSFLPRSYYELLDNLSQDVGAQFLDIRHKTELLTEYLLEKLNVKNFLLVNIGDDFTEIALIKDGQAKGCDSFAIGSSFFTKALSENMGIGFIEAEGIKLSYCRGKLKKVISDKVKDIFLENTAFWSSQARLSLLSLLKSELMPERIYLSGEGSILPEMPESFKINGSATKNLPALSPSETSLLLTNIDSIFTGTTKSIDLSTDAAIVASGYAALNLLEKNGLNSLFKNIINNT